MRIIKGEQPLELETKRIEALSDGVFAIAMTLLILELKVPEIGHGAAASELPRGLLALWPKFLCYVISFITLGVYWVAHHLHFLSIKRADRMLLWINILILMAISLIPFTTALIGEYVTARLPVMVYGVNLVCVGLLLELHWRYATKGHRLVDADLDPALIRSVSQVILLGPAIYLAAIALCFVSTWISIALYLLVNFLYMIPGGLHLHMQHRRKHESPS